ncbi:MAG: cupin domain-containing protein [Clostridiales Family XIII bacterium]|jgi:mannose-6-phosphate isomerase-like protein (cupin superfamily)|nr:cupin domain-containing protein [Clostridiales Family XIII bacterium]
MKKISINDVGSYSAPGHFDVACFRLQGKEESGIKTFWIGKSVFLPGGGAEWGYEKDSPNEKVYIVLEGEMTVKSKDETFHLVKGDTLFIGPNEGREMKNEGKGACELLVVIAYGAPPA